MGWKPIPKVTYAAVLGPVLAAGLTWITSGSLDWRVPLASVLTALIAYLVPATAPVNPRQAVRRTTE